MEQSVPPPPPPPPYDQPVSPPPPPPPPSPMAPPPRSNKGMWIIIGVIVIAVVVIAAAFFVLGGFGGNGNGNGDNAPVGGDLQVGDFFKWVYEEDSDDGDYTSTWWMNVTAVDDQGCEVLITISDVNGDDSGTYYYYNDELLCPFGLPDDMVDKGTKTISTEFGSRSTDRYLWETTDVTENYYFGVNNGVFYKGDTSGQGYTGEMKLVDSNISWV